MRPASENQLARELALDAGKPIVSGGDRHATEANVILNLTNASSFCEFTGEVRGGHRSVVVMPSYRQPLWQWLLHQTDAVLANYPHHGRGWARWDQRVFYTADSGETFRLSDLWRKAPAAVDLFVRAVRALQHPGMRFALRSTAMGAGIV